MDHSKRQTPSIQQVSSRLDSLEETNLQLIDYLKLKMKQINDIETKLNDKTGEREIQKKVDKLNDDFYLLQNNTLNKRTIDMIINSKTDTISKNVKDFSEIIETKLINKISKLEENCNLKFNMINNLISRVDRIDELINRLPTTDDLSSLSKRLSDRIDSVSSSYDLSCLSGQLSSRIDASDNNLKNFQESVNSRLETIGKTLGEDIKKLDDELCKKFNNIDSFILNYEMLKLQIVELANKVEPVVANSETPESERLTLNAE